MNTNDSKRTRLRNSFDFEAVQLDFLRTGFRSEECALIPEDEETESILGIVLDETGWEDHSGKDVPPPDFVNHGQHVMLEAMRVDDHERPGNKKNCINPLRAHESEIIRQYEHEFREILDMAADDARLTIIGNTDLPTEEDHGYGMYLDGFRRIVEKHARHADNYRSNHPGYKLVFYIFDESTGYVESTEPIKNEIHAGDCLRGQPHYFFADAAFLDVIRNSKADFFIWRTPFKHEHLFEEGLMLPETVVYDVARMNVPDIYYDKERMVSMEV